MVNVNKNEISDNFENYFITLKEKINNIYLNTNESNETVLDILKIYEKKVLFDILYLCPKSVSRVTKSHRKSNDEKIILVNANALSHCNIEEKVKIGSYINIENKRLVHMKSESIPAVEYDLTKIWKSVDNLICFKKKNNLPMYLFTDDNNQIYPLYYKNSKKKHCGFQNNSYKLIKQEFMNKFDNKIIANIFKKITSLNQIFKKISTCDIKFEECTNIGEQIITDEINYNDMWKEIFETIGMLPKDCQCKAYGKTVYNRCVLSGKSLRGIRPKHSVECSKKLIK
tara:strand:+ start:1391 stop:2245 length:855 start_codon:yes stop_codon:yes gene_type:complete